MSNDHSYFASIQKGFLAITAIVSVITATFGFILFPALNVLIAPEVESNNENKNGLMESIKQELFEARNDIQNAKLRYISCTAHDLKTPLQSFVYSITLLEQTNLNEEQKKLCLNAKVASELMKITISQAMDVSKSLSGGEIVPHKKETKLAKLIEHVSMIVSGFGSEVPVTYAIDESLPLTVYTDEDWVAHMIINLITNACKHTEQGYIKIQAAFSSDRSHIIFSVYDTGVGVIEAKRHLLFKPFSQMQKGQSTGTGLGLYGVMLRAQSLGGACGMDPHVVEQHGDAGCTFWFSIPLAYSSGMSRAPIVRSLSNAPGNTSPPSSLAPIPSASPFHGHPKVYMELDNKDNSPSSSDHLQDTMFPTGDLDSIGQYDITAFVADDVQSIRKMLAKVLESCGIKHVECFENGKKVLDAMMLRHVDVVFMDIQMPIMSGIEVGR